MGDEKALGIGEVLSKEGAPAPEPETTTPEPTVEGEAPITEMAPIAKEKPTEPAPIEQSIGLKAMLAERRKWQDRLAQAEAKIAQYETPAFEEPAVEPAPQQGVTEFQLWKLGYTEKKAKEKYGDFQEKYNAFLAACINPATGEVTNPALYQTIMGSEDPGESAYQAGQAELEAKEVGGWENYSHPVKYREAIEKKLEAKIRDKIRAEVEAELTGKIATKQNQPTNILGMRSAAGGGGEYQPLSMRDLLTRRKG